MDTLTTVTVYAGVASYDHAISLPVCVPVNRDQLVLPLCSNPTEPVCHAYSTSVYVTTTPLETTLAQGLNRYVSRAGASSPADALRPRCLDTYPWESRFQLSARLTDARHLLKNYMRNTPAIPLRQLLTLCPELRPTAADLKAHRWTRTDAVREYAHVTGAQRTAWTEAINCYIRTTEPSFRDLDDLRATLIPVMAHAQMTGGNQ